jgi:hypothetical protein
MPSVKIKGVAWASKRLLTGAPPPLRPVYR